RSLAEALLEEDTAAAGLSFTDDSPFVGEATDQCWERVQNFLKNASHAANPNVVSAGRIRKETGVRVDANPYYGITRFEIHAVVRAAYRSIQNPEVLLALWAKEGSTRSYTTAQEVPGATTAANAKTLFRSG